MSDIVLKRPNGETFTTSLLLAEKFKKEHRTILRKIKSLPKDDFTQHNFVLSEYIDESGKTNKQYELTRDGFSYLAMGFTGKEAHQWKVNFIDAFNKMERHLRNMLKKEWIEHRAEAALEYKMMSRTLQEVRRLEGKTTRHFHFANEVKLVNWALTGEFKKVDRAALSDKELGVLVTLEAYNAVLLGAGHDRDTRKELLKNRCKQAMQDLLGHAA